jgi:hypothetical protein
MTDPRTFMSGFVAQRFAREEQEKAPDAEVKVVSIPGPGHAKELKDGSFIWARTHRGFMVEKTEHGISTYLSATGEFVPAPQAEGENEPSG